MPSACPPHSRRWGYWRPWRRGRAFFDVPGVIWTAFSVCVGIGLAQSVLKSFFRIHALSGGMTVAQAGVLLAVSSAVGAAVRFASGPILGAGIGLLHGFSILLPLFAGLGLSRGCCGWPREP